jgi:hypothetical protein
MKRTLFVSLIIVLLAFTITISVSGSDDPSLLCTPPSGGVVDKAAGDSFMVSIAFKNTGKTVGKWSVNVAFEGANWAWAGLSQNLTLGPDEMRLLTWNGAVPSLASVSSIARLVVYHNDSFVALNWWINVTPGAQLSIIASTVH